MLLTLSSESAFERALNQLALGSPCPTQPNQAFEGRYGIALAGGGDWRIIFDASQSEIVVLAIGHRREVIVSPAGERFAVLPVLYHLLLLAASEDDEGGLSIWKKCDDGG